MKMKRYGMRLIPALLLIVLALTALTWGTWSAAAPARQTAQYPQYGHADDFSWVAGKVQMHKPSGCSGIECGCFIVGYDTSGARVQLNAAPGGYTLEYTDEFSEGEFLVLFGRLAQNGDPVLVCPADNAPVYIIDKVELNK